MTTFSEQERKLMDLLAHSVHRKFVAARAADVPVDVFEDVEVIARSMTAALPTIHIDGYGQIVGPFYDTTGLAQWRGVSRQAINKAARAQAVIACRLVGGKWVYPTWQFTDSRTTHPDLATLWATLRAAGDSWTCAIWLRNPQTDLGDRSPVDWIFDGRSLEVVLDLARVDAQGWAA